VCVQCGPACAINMRAWQEASVRKGPARGQPTCFDSLSQPQNSRTRFQYRSLPQFAYFFRVRPTPQRPFPVAHSFLAYFFPLVTCRSFLCVVRANWQLPSPLP
jgi:hypothetical protein